MKRRQFLARSVQLALGSSAASLLSGAFSPAAIAESELVHFREIEARTLTVMARALFPHRDLDDSYYFAVVKQLDALPAETLALIDDGLARMNGNGRRSWIERPVEQKLAALEKLQHEPFFAVILNKTIDVLYRNPDVWKLLGYQGSSIEFGGYLNRGFDDIDWLT